jgi:hypothetical protein
LLWKMQPRLHWGRSGPCMWLVYECVFLKKINFFLFLNYYFFNILVWYISIKNKFFKNKK